MGRPGQKQDKKDGRTLDHKTLESIRHLAISKVLDGENPESVIQTLGLTRSCIYKWLAKYKAGGLDALNAKSISGRPNKVEQRQVNQLYEWLLDSTPPSHGMPQGLWTRELVRSLLQNKYGMQLSLASVSRLLKKLGLIFHQPLHKYVEKGLPPLKIWLETDYQRIRSEARRTRAEIYVGWEETLALKSDSSGLVQLSAVNSRGTEHFLLAESAVKDAHLRSFIDGLRLARSRPVFLLINKYQQFNRPFIRNYIRADCPSLNLFFMPTPSQHGGEKIEITSAESPGLQQKTAWKLKTFLLSLWIFLAPNICRPSAASISPAENSLLVAYLEIQDGIGKSVELSLDRVILCGKKDTVFLQIHSDVLNAKDGSGKQFLLCEQDIPPGQYTALKFYFSRILATVQTAKIDINLPAKEAIVPLDLDAESGAAAPLFLNWDPGLDVFDGKIYRPALNAKLEPRISPASMVFVSNTGSNHLTCIDRFRKRVINVIKVGLSPKDMVFSVQRHELYVANSGSDDISVIDVNTGRLEKSIKLRSGDEPTRMALSPDQRRLFILDAGTNSVSLVDLLGYHEASRIHLEAAPTSLAIDERNNIVYVTSRDSDRLFGIDPNSLSVVTILTFGANLDELIFSSTDRKLLVAKPDQRQLVVFNITKNGIEGHLKLCAHAAGLAFQNRTGNLFVSVPDCQCISILKPSSALDIGTINTPYAPGRIQMDLESKYLLVTFPREGKLGFYNANSWEGHDFLEVGKSPHTICFTQ